MDRLAKRNLFLRWGKDPEDQLLIDEGGAVDPHIWFDIDLWKQARDAATEELKAYSTEDADYFEGNKQNYFAKLDELKEESIHKLQIPEHKRVLVTAHDAFGYFGRMQGIKVVGLQGFEHRGRDRAVGYSRKRLSC